MGFPIRDDDDRPVTRTDETRDTGASREALVFSFATFSDAQAAVVCASAEVLSTQAEPFGFVRRWSRRSSGVLSRLARGSPALARGDRTR